MEMHWIKRSISQQTTEKSPDLPQEKPFIAILHGHVNLVLVSEDSAVYFDIKDGFTIECLHPAIIQYWMPLPEAPKPKEPSQYLSYE